MKPKAAEPRYVLSLGGEVRAEGDMASIQTFAADIVTTLLADDPDGVALSASQANADFQRGVVASWVAETGEWSCPFWVHGEATTLKVTGVE